jgi:hypothetical protein
VRSGARGYAFSMGSTGGMRWAMDRCAWVPLNVTLVVSPEHFPESSSRPPQPLLASQPVSLDGIRSSVLKRSLNLVT